MDSVLKLQPHRNMALQGFDDYGAAAALWGASASGTATESSDIDLLVISRSTLPRREREVRLTPQLFGSGVPYDLLVLTPEEVEERLRRNGPFIQQILSTGQVVYQRP
jgi:predicted nucleotidyltransferase